MDKVQRAPQRPEPLRYGVQQEAMVFADCCHHLFVSHNIAEAQMLQAAMEELPQVCPTNVTDVTSFFTWSLHGFV
jgi:hypothetical protein